MKLRCTTVALAAVALLGAPAAASETGDIKGIVVNETTGRPAAGADVILAAARADGSDRIDERTVTDRRGRYRFEDLPAGDDRFYVVDVRYDGGLFPGSPLSIPATTKDAPVIDTRTKVWDTTADPRTVLIGRDDLFVTPGAGGLDVVESITVANVTERAYVGRGAPGAPTLGLPLPADARSSGIEIIDSDLDVPELVRTDFGAGLTIAIPPGEWTFTYAYRVTGTAGTYDLSRPALYPVVRASLHAAEGIELASNRLVPNGDVTIGGTKYVRRSATEAIDEGDRIQMSATATAAGNSPALTAGIVAAVALGVALVAGTVWRSRRTPAGAPEAAMPEPATPEARGALVRAIAELDIRRDAGEIDEGEWSIRRAELKARLAHLPAESTR